MKSLQGHLLVAAPTLVDPNFFHAVVLIVQHNDEGALGLVLNRPLQTTIADMWEQVGEGECTIEGPLHQGGPCEGPLMVIHRDKSAADIKVSSGVYFCTNRERIETLINKKQAKPTAGGTHDMKFFVGYAGWTAGQLEAEMAESSWLTIDANPKAVFEGDEHLWTDLSRAIARAELSNLVDPKRIPEDPSVN
jgi:putative transcriptional regulator